MSLMAVFESTRSSFDQCMNKENMKRKANFLYAEYEESRRLEVNFPGKGHKETTSEPRIKLRRFEELMKPLSNPSSVPLDVSYQDIYTQHVLASYQVKAGQLQHSSKHSCSPQSVLPSQHPILSHHPNQTSTTLTPYTVLTPLSSSRPSHILTTTPPPTYEKQFPRIESRTNRTSHFYPTSESQSDQQPIPVHQKSLPRLVPLPTSHLFPRPTTSLPPLEPLNKKEPTNLLKDPKSDLTDKDVPSEQNFPSTSSIERIDTYNALKMKTNAEQETETLQTKKFIANDATSKKTCYQLNLENFNNKSFKAQEDDGKCKQSIEDLVDQVMAEESFASLESKRLMSSPSRKTSDQKKLYTFKEVEMEKKNSKLKFLLISKSVPCAIPNRDTLQNALQSEKLDELINLRTNCLSKPTHAGQSPKLSLASGVNKKDHATPDNAHWLQCRPGQPILIQDIKNLTRNTSKLEENSKIEKEVSGIKDQLDMQNSDKNLVKSTKIMKEFGQVCDENIQLEKTTRALEMIQLRAENCKEAKKLISDITKIRRNAEKDLNLVLYQDLLGNYALHTAVLLRNPKLVRRYSLAMKIFNISLEVRNRNGETALQLSLHLGELETMKELLIQGASLTAPDNQGNTVAHLLVLATNSSIFNIASQFLDQSILDRQNDAGFTPLHLAVLSRSEEKIIKLLDMGANPHIQNNLTGETPLCLLDRRHLNHEFVSFLQSKGILFNLQNTNQAFLKHISCSTGNEY